MSVLSTITVTLKDDAAEAAFVKAFTKALEATAGFPGLEKLIASKVIGADRTYHLHSEWTAPEAMEAWQSDESYRTIRDAFDVSIVAGIEVSRWTRA